jgi:plastocyanin
MRIARNPSPAVNPIAEDPMSRSPLIALLALTGLTSLAGCGGDEPAPAAAAAARAEGLVVDLSASQFSPAMLDARVGETITFVNRDAIAHTATAAAGARFDSGSMEDGARFSFTPRAAGVIAVVCVFHPGMTGSITVS